jgi:NAD(P)-dependent dehydrogenase (short-subunit alcohol dehydrogenase family)
MYSATHKRIILVTSASEGVGADVAQQFSGVDTHVLVNYRSDSDRAELVAEAIRVRGGHATTICADVSDEADTATMVDAIATRFGRLDTVVLNASGDVEPGADAGDSMRRYRDAHRRLTRLAIPLMPIGGHVVFVTNHQAHFFPNKAVPKGFAAVAAGQRASETALYSLHAELDRARIRYTVVSGSMFDQTIEERLVQRGAAAPADTRHDRAPSSAVHAVTTAVVDAASAVNPSSIVFVGTDFPKSA